MASLIGVKALSTLRQYFGPAQKALQRRRGSVAGWSCAPILLACLLALLSLTAIVGCGGGEEEAASGSKTLKIAVAFNPGSLDPDIFYGSEGLLVTTSCYEGLLRYKDNSTKIEPALAKSYSITNAGKTYTFHLQPNVTFADGSKLTSKVLKFDIERRKALAGGPSYMVANVAKVDTPDPLTLVIHLSKTTNPFLAYLASPYGLKAISQVAIKAHSSANDPWAKNWLASHSAGTGPYVLSNVQSNQFYNMAANSEYWGSPAPYYSTIQISQVPSFATQQLELRSGSLDLMTHGLTPKEVESFKQDSSFQVKVLPSIVVADLWINPHKEPFTDPRVREAAQMAINRPRLMKEVFGISGQVVNEIASPGTLPAKYGGSYEVSYDPAKAKQTVESLLPSGQRKVTIYYQTNNAANQQLGGLIAAELSAVGFEAVNQGVPETAIYSYHSASEDKRPNMLIDVGNPDDADPTSSTQTKWLNTPSATGFFNPYSDEGDRLVFEGEEQASTQRAYEFYGKAFDAYGALHVVVPLGAVNTVVVARNGISGIAAQRQGSFLINLTTLKGE